MPKRKKSRTLSGTTTAAVGKAGLLARYNSMPENSAKTKWVRSGVDVAGALAGGGLASMIGKNAAFLGLGVLLAGNFMKDKSGLCRTIGTGMLVYGTAKFFENNAKPVAGFTLAGAAEGAKERIIQFKDEVLAAFYLDRLFKKTPSGGADDSGSVEGLDLSSLDFFDENNFQEATEFEINRDTDPDELPEPLSNYSSSGREFDYTIENDLPDMSQL